MAKLKMLADVIDQRAVTEVMIQAAKIIQSEAKVRAPRGKTGRLEQSIVVTGQAKRKRKKGRMQSYCYVDKSIAPHAHLIEYGTAVRVPVSKKVMADQEAGIIYGKHADPMPAHPFFRPAVDHKEAEAATYMSNGVLRVIDEAAAKQ
jgi:HK97 gp10 family phage protein